MGKPTKRELKYLNDLANDYEAYHGLFDDMVQQRLLKLDPQWMKTMQKVYNKSGFGRWYA